MKDPFLASPWLVRGHLHFYMMFSLHVSVFNVLFIRTSVIMIRALFKDPILTTNCICPKTFFSNKVAFSGNGGYNFNI